MSEFIRLLTKPRPSPFTLIPGGQSIKKSDKQPPPQVSVEGVPPLPGAKIKTQDQET